MDVVVHVDATFLLSVTALFLAVFALGFALGGVGK